MSLEEATKLAKQNVLLSEAEFKVASGKTANLQAEMALKRSISESMSDAYVLVACRGDLLATDFKAARDKDIRALSEAMIATEEFYKAHEELVVKHQQYSLWRSVLSHLCTRVRITIQTETVDSDIGCKDSDTVTDACDEDDDSDSDSDSDSSLTCAGCAAAA